MKDNRNKLTAPITFQFATANGTILTATVTGSKHLPSLSLVVDGRNYRDGLYRLLSQANSDLAAWRFMPRQRVTVTIVDVDGSRLARSAPQLAAALLVALATR